MRSDDNRSGWGRSEAHALRLVNSYRKWTGRELQELRSDVPVQEQLFHAPIVLLSHGTEADPVLNFGNANALKLWEMDWPTFTNMPSRQTAEPMAQDVRDRFMKSVQEKGYSDGYTGVRVSATGRRFYIMDAVVWNVVDEEGRYCGQAAAFREHRYISDETA